MEILLHSFLYVIVWSLHYRGWKLRERNALFPIKIKIPINAIPIWIFQEGKTPKNFPDSKICFPPNFWSFLIFIFLIMAKCEYFWHVFSSDFHVNFTNGFFIVNMYTSEINKVKVYGYEGGILWQVHVGKLPF
jgi:hypothetical protein